MKKQYFILTMVNGEWKKLSAPAPTITDADIIAKNILAVKKNVSKVAVVSYDAKGVAQKHREYSKNPAKKTTRKTTKKNPEIHIDIDSHNAEKSSKAKTNPVILYVVKPKGANYHSGLFRKLSEAKIAAQALADASGSQYEIVKEIR